MSDSLVLYLDRGDVMHVIDPDTIQNFDEEIPQLMMIAIAIINEGYQGVVIDECRLKNGGYFHAINANLDTYEGLIFNNLQVQIGELPSPEAILEKIKAAYANSRRG